MNYRRLLSIDPSLTCSGWALFSFARGELLGVGKIRALPCGRPFADRIRDLQVRITAFMEQLALAQGDVLICEAQTTMRDPRAAFVVEQVRGLFEILARSRGVLVPGRVNPRSVHYEILKLGGRQQRRSEVKAAAVAAVHHIYATHLRRLGFDPAIDNLRKNQDVVDAILVGALGLARVAAAQHAKARLEEIFDERSKMFRRLRRKVAEAAA